MESTHKFNISRLQPIFVVALYLINMAPSSTALASFWERAFVGTDLAPNSLAQAQKQKRMRQDALAE